MAPFESMANPGGSALPGLTETILTPTPPLTVSVEVKAVPTIPTIDCGDVIVGAAAAICVLAVKRKFAIDVAARFTDVPAAFADESALTAEDTAAFSSAFNFFTAAISGVD